jgi:hypothetical protein
VQNLDAGDAVAPEIYPGTVATRTSADRVHRAVACVETIVARLAAQLVTAAAAVETIGVSPESAR